MIDSVLGVGERVQWHDTQLGTKAISAKIYCGGGFDWGRQGAGTRSYQADKTPWSGQGLGSLQCAGSH